MRGDPGRAIPVFERGLVVTRMADIPILFPFIAAPLGAAYTLAGRAHDALPLLEQAMRQATSLKLFADRALWLTWLGEALAAVGQVDRAGKQAAEAVTLAGLHGERGNQAYARRLAAEVAARREPPDFDSALDEYGDALRVSTELGMRPLAARCRLGLAVTHYRMGERAAARTEVAAAAEALREMGMVHWLSRAEALESELRG